MENTGEHVYQPKLGDNNRYENAQISNKQLAEQINKEAMDVVNNAMSVLQKIRENPSLKDSHDPKTGPKWAGEWLKDQVKFILNDLYGAVQLDGLSGVPKEVEWFVKDVYQTVKM